jgi:RES domain-containing protein
VSAGFTLWRIAVDTPEFTADDTTGAAAKATGGRWNRKGHAVLYTSTSVALACLETVVHSKTGSLPMNRYLVRIDLPMTAWSARTEHAASSLPIGWDALPEGKVSLDLGDAWIPAGESPLLAVPSVIVPEELNVLINPEHPLCRGMTAKKLRKWSYDPRLFGLHS